MSSLTGLLYGGLVLYLGGWYLGKWTGNFSLLLFVLTLVTFGYWLAERFVFAPRRVSAATTLEHEDAARRKLLARQGITKVDGDVNQAKQAVLTQPWWLDWTAGLFPVILIVFLLRSFLFEPFKIPSGSMIPTLLVGDLILVNKYHYGVRLPVINKKIIANHDPKRGDVMVFRYPEDPSLDYIKRVVGVPGDRVEYRNKRLTINGQPVPLRQVDDYLSKARMQFSRRFVETINATEHQILIEDDAPAFMAPSRAFPHTANCNYNMNGLACTVPPGHYFMMGDNRDNSSDSRVWGFVPDGNIVGKAFFIWLNLNELGRFGTFR
jgi:signal peptidase I